MARYAAAGALCCTPTDYAKFMPEVLNPGRSDFRPPQTDAIHEMLRPHVKVVNGPYTCGNFLGPLLAAAGIHRKRSDHYE